MGLAVAGGLAAALVTLNSVLSADRESKLAGAAAKAERILIAIPEEQGVSVGQAIDIAPGKPFKAEIQRTFRGTGKKGQLVKIINSGDEKQHPKFVAGKSYLFLLKKDPETKAWVHLLATELPVRDGKLQFLEGGKVVEEMAVDDFEDLTAKESTATVEKVPTRDTLTDKWIVIMSEKGQNFHLWLIDLAQGEKDNAKETTAKLLSTSKAIRASTLKSSSIVENDIQLVFDADGMPFDFRGRIENGVVRGNMLIAGSTILPARLLPTDVKNLRNDAEPVPDAAREDFIDAAGQEESFVPLTRFVRRHPESPLAIPGFMDLIAHAKAAGYDHEKFEKLAADYRHTASVWGPRMELKADVDLGISLAKQAFLPELALQYLTTANEKFGDDSPVEWRLGVQVELGKQLLAVGRDAEGTALLGRLREEHPFEVDVTYALARQAEKEKKIDEALQLFGEIVILPQMQRDLLELLKSRGNKLAPENYPSRVVTRLWTEKHGDRKGLSAWLDELYESRIHSIATDKVPPRGKNEGTQVVLCELFTNGDCPPCVGADLATEALESTYEKSEVIVLRYHQHKPGPDPLANEDSLDRFKQYQCDGTPTLIINGRRFSGGGGFIANVPSMYQRYRTYIDPILKEKTDMRLELSAAANAGKVSVSAKALGLKFPANARLMLLIAEEKIDCVLNNGIRTHGMIVRSIVGGLEGTAAAKGKLEYTGEVDLLKLKKRIAKQLVAVQRENHEEFDEIPLDFKSLYLIGMVQNAENGEVSQSAAIPISGTAAGIAEPKSGDKSDGAEKPAAGGN